jgi:hypothetical protein
MKLSFKTTNPITLKNDIIKLIEDDELQTWEIDEISGEKYLKHIGQWGDKGVIKLTIDNIKKTLIIQVMKFKNVTENVVDFEGYYLGRFCEIIFVNFPNKFTTIDKE